MPDYKIRIVVEGVDKASGPLGRASGSLQRIGEFAAGGLLARGISNVVSGAGRATQALGAMVMEGASFEAQVDAINSLMGGTEQQAAQIAELITDLGIDPKLKVTSQEAADTIGMLVRNGAEWSDISSTMARDTVLLANATGADFGTAADIATDAMAIFNMQADEMGQVVDNISGVVTGSKFSINDYRLALAQGGAAAAVAGLSMEEFNAAIGAIAPNFASGSDAGTSLKTMMQRLVPETDKAQAAMQALGLSFVNADGSMKTMAEVAGELNRAFQGQVEFSNVVGGRTADQNKELKRLGQQYQRTKAAIGDYEAGIKGAGYSEERRAKKVAELRSQLAAVEEQMEPLNAIQDDLVTTTRALTEEERIHYLNTIFGTDAMRAAAGMAEYTAEEFTALQEAYLSGDAEAAAAMRMDNLAGDMEILGGIFETIRLEIGSKFQPAMRSGVQALTGFVTAASPAIESMASALAANLQPYADAFAEWADGAVEHFSRVSEAMGGGVTGFVSGLGAITGGAVTFDAEAQISAVDWGDYSYTYDALSGVTSVQWGAWTHSYESEAGVYTVDWDAGGVDGSFSYSADSGITNVDWHEDWFDYSYNAEAGVHKVDWEAGGTDATFIYSAEAGITNIDWKEEQFGFIYDAEAGVASVNFGEDKFSATYDVGAKVISVDWGETSEQVAQWLDETSASISSFFGGGEPIAINAEVADVEWGDHTSSYDVSAKVAESGVTWGEWMHAYEAGAMIPETNVFWGQWMGQYPATADVRSVDWGNFSHTYNAKARVEATVDYIAGDFSGPSVSPNPSDPVVPRAVGDLNWRGGLVQVHRDEIIGVPRGSRIFTRDEARQMQAGSGAGLVIQNVTLANDMDVQAFGYQLMDYLNMRR